MSKPPSRKKSYEATSDALAIVDRRQFTNGAIVPNYVIDLWLPILEYCGLGVWATVVRLASFDSSDGKPRVHLNQLASSGGMGFRRLRKILELLNELKFIKLHVPTGQERGLHYRTVIEIFDPPTEVPRKHTKNTRGRTYLKDVHQLSATSWLIERKPEASEMSPDTSPECHVTLGEVSPDTFMEVSPDISMEVSPDIPIRKETISKETIDKETTHTHTPRVTASPPPVGVCVSKFDYETRKRYQESHFSSGPNRDRVPLGEGWMVTSRDGRYDDLITAWLSAPTKIDPGACPDCLGSGFIQKTLFDNRGAQRCAHPKLRGEDAAL